MGYEPLPIVEVDVDDLRLDLDNYRIPTRRDDEEAALKYLFAPEDVLGRRMIVRDGYFDNEVPVVVADDPGGYVVLEGNRRVSALKALLDHSDPWARRRHAGPAEAIRSGGRTVAGSHPGDGRREPQPGGTSNRPTAHRSFEEGMVARPAGDLLPLLLDASTTPEDVRAHYPDVNVTRLLKMAAVRRFVANAKFTDRSLRSWVSGQGGGVDGELKMSAFEYAYKVKEIAAAIGLSFDRDGLIEPRTKTPGADRQGARR